jgi:parallel beta-helix repeat protein
MTNGGDIELRYSSNNVFTGNNIAPSRYGAGFELESSNNNIIFGNNIWGSIELHDSSGNSISENNITKSGIQLWASSNNKIYGNSITNSSAGITLLWASHKNTIRGNNITNGEYGIRLSGSVDVGHRECPENNIIYRNNIANNTKAGVEIGGIITPGGALNNIFYHNNFLNNTPQVQIVRSYKNMWHNGYPSGGNYWSDYNGTDFYSGPNQDQLGGDGIGDTSYVIDENNQDNYPLMNPYALLGDLNNDGVVNILDISIFGKAYGSYPGHSRWNPTADLDGNGVINILDGVIIAKNFGKKW